MMPAHATTSSVSDRVGLSSHLFWLGESDAEAQMRQMTAGGVNWIREDFLWDQIQPTPTTFSWSRTDGLMTAASRTGINVLAILDYSAPWASSDPSGAGNTHYPPSQPATFAAYASAVVARYGAGGTFWLANPQLVARPLGAVEVWNEPWGDWDWLPAPDPAGYAALARATAVAVHSLHPEIKVILSGDLLEVRPDGAIVGWFDNVLSADPTLGALVDAYSLHPYPDPGNMSPDDNSGDPRWAYGRVTMSRDIAAAHNASHPFWITEVGWTTAVGTSIGVSEATQATYTQAALTDALVGWGSFIDKIFIYTWDTSTGTVGDNEGNYGLRRSDGSFKPAWSALTQFIASNPPVATASTAPSTTTSTTPSPAPTTTSTTGPAASPPAASTAPAPTPSPVRPAAPSSPSPTAPSPTAARTASGYRFVAADGGIFSFGGDAFHGSVLASTAAVGMAGTPSGDGYWVAYADGSVRAFGDAVDYGSTSGRGGGGAIVGMAASPSGAGYWLVARDGEVLPFGQAGNFGSMAGVALSHPIVGMAATPDGGGYWLVGSDGGIFAFGDAPFYGSTGGMRLNRPIVGMTATPDGRGYWFVASDGGIFAYGDAAFFGSTGGLRLNQPVVGMTATPGGDGYWMVASDGGIFAFGHAPFYGSTGGLRLSQPILGMSA